MAALAMVSAAAGTQVRERTAKGPVTEADCLPAPAPSKALTFGDPLPPDALDGFPRALRKQDAQEQELCEEGADAPEQE